MTRTWRLTVGFGYMKSHRQYNALIGWRRRAISERDSKSSGPLEEATDALQTKGIFLTLFHLEELLRIAVSWLWQIWLRECNVTLDYCPLISLPAAA
jgi:hypothetical protein